jgi:hypothetical protein
MASSRTRTLTTLQQLASLRTGRFFSEDWVRRWSEMQHEQANEESLCQPMDTAVYKLAALGWQLATTAQCSAYLADSLQLTAEMFAESQIECQESTYNQLCSSIGMLQCLLTTIRGRLDAICEKEDVSELLHISTAVGEVIRSMSAQGPATTTVGYTINTASQETTRSADAGDMK